MGKFFHTPCFTARDSFLLFLACPGISPVDFRLSFFRADSLGESKLDDTLI